MKLKKHQFVTGLIAIYAIFMALYFGPDLLKEGKALRFWVTLGCEAIVIVLAYFALKRRDEYREQKRSMEKEESQN